MPVITYLLTVGIDVIFISAGHNPLNPGARFGHFIEYDEAQIWAKLLTEALNELTRVPESPPAILVPTGLLKEKAKFINARALPGDIAVEIHFNDATDGEGAHIGSGCEVLHYPSSEKGKALASSVLEPLAVVFPPSRGVKAGWYRLDPKFGPDFFLAKTNCPAIIIEPEFVRNAETIRLKRDAAIAAVAFGLRDHVYGRKRNNN